MQEPQKLWNANFVVWWLGSVQSGIGSALAGIALSFLVLEQTGSAGAMGLNLALAMLPALLSPLAGTLVDRVPLKLPLVLGDLARGLIVGGVGVWALSGGVPLLLIYSLSLLQGLIGALYQPAAGALVPRLVPRERLGQANALLGAAHQGANLIGLVGGGLLVSRVGNAPSLLLDAASFVVMAALLLFVRVPARAAREDRRGFWADFRAGFDRLRRSRVLVLVAVLAFFINAAIAPMQMLLPRRMLDLGSGAAGYGTFMGCLMAGMLLGSSVVAALGSRLAPRPAAGLGLVVIGASLGLLSAAPSTVSMWLFAALAGSGMGITNAAVPTLVQALVKQEYLGRVFSFIGMLAQIGMPLTLLLLAPIADRIALSGVFLTAGGVVLLSAVAWALWGFDRPSRGVLTG